MSGFRVSLVVNGAETGDPLQEQREMNFFSSSSLTLNFLLASVAENFWLRASVVPLFCCDSLTCAFLSVS